jgi:hypothetical protein
MSPRFRLLLSVALLAAAGLAVVRAQERAGDTKSDCTRDESKPADVSAAKDDAKPAEPAPERPAPPTTHDSTGASPESPPANNAAPTRDAAKPARPAVKQRPVWPPPPELIS